MSETPILIVGAGVAGLVCAARLARAGHAVRVLEREPEVGGRVRSRVVDGYVVDRGFQVLFTGYPTLRDALGLDARGRDATGDDPLALRRFVPGARVATDTAAPLVGDALRDPRLLGTTILAGALGTADKLRLLALRRLATSLSVDDCFAAEYDAVPARDFLAARGISRRAVQRFFAPFYGGILLDPTLGASAAVLLFTFKMLAEGDTVVPAAGMGALTRRLAERLPAGTVRTGVGVASLVVEGGRARGVLTDDGARLDAAHVVLATEAPAAARLAAAAGVALPGHAAGAHDTALGCATVFLASDAPPLPGGAIWLDAAGHEREGAPAISHAVTLTEVAPEYATPDARHGAHLLAATAVGEAARQGDDALIEGARRTVAAMRRAGRLGTLPALRPIAIERVPYAQFAQPPGARARRTPASAGVPGLWRASETAHSSSLEGAARGGVLAAEAIVEAARTAGAGRAG